MIKIAWFEIVNAIYKYAIYICVFKFLSLIYIHKTIVSVVIANRVYDSELQM